jgi:hypothetical protein
MKIYLDSCSLQRPLDDQSQVRIATETEAIMGVLTLWEAGKIGLVGSEALNYEADQIPMRERRAYMEEVLAKMEEFVMITEAMELRAATFVAEGLKPLDALHLSCAEESKVDYFVPVMISF